MSYQFVPMTHEDAHVIVDWSYEGPYSFYDVASDPEDRDLFLDESKWENRSFAVYDDDGLAGFFTFAVVDDVVELGLGMEPSRTGRGRGVTFVEAGLDFARERYDPQEFRLAVATFNERAIRVYESVGFEKEATFQQETNGGAYEFVAMSCSATPRLNR
ncbi:ribosomal-protein-alanine N-acetyltransferase [Halogranum rubrum]|uniref:Ribosomal-protein-alanine N-acetyltransferase n=1 Tax=Halogranum rubrum TaxID=553466 RepID=A0A1I4H5J0_9EURY|nr:GNAT family protein [Halogranum rubrum]SFL37524.1 ribosomal-protein-alanine N-acetyltransferase [Halogranum rubrum]